jgi:uncharacterized protein YyaL (SSP411 family)
MPTNLLSREKSPYLLQHAHNPVNWYPWGEEAFRKAREENKPIFLSIGYSTCHWCHVMERESFENDVIADLLNRRFVSIKVDREERPDIDRAYMLFVQATTGSGGWPMSVFLTPELKPFFGGTYFPPERRWGQPGFAEVLERVAEAWAADHDSIVESSADIVEQLKRHSETAARPGVPDATLLDGGFYAFRRSFDPKRGGFGGAPKFPRPSVHNFLLRYYHRTRNVEALEMVFATLNAMAHGGMRDHLGGGFHRYSVDDRWFLPHFEKMLYDQAQLAVSYLEGYQLSNDQYYAEVARDTLDYVLRDMTSSEGAFYSAEDADSVIDPAQPNVKGEGAFYVWTKQEIEKLLGPQAAGEFCLRYGVEPQGNVAHDPHGEFTGKNILFDAHPEQPPPAGARETLLEARARRVRPHLDDKILTGWNGLMITAFARAAQVLDDPRYLEAARRAADFILSRLRTEAGLLRRYRDGEAAIPGFLDDYALFAQALLDLYETAFDIGDLDAAVRITDRMTANFEDPDQGGFFSAPPGDPELVLRIKDDYDGAEPSGNSIAALNLLRLAELTGREDYRRSAERVFAVFASRIASVPEAVPQMLAGLEFALSKPRQIVLVGDRGADDMRAMVRQLNSRFVPNRVVLMLDSDEARRFFAAHLPATHGMDRIGGSATAYLCENYACRLPTNDPGAFAEQLAA